MLWQTVPHAGIDLSSPKHMVHIHMAVTERGDKSFSCSKQIAASYAGKAWRRSLGSLPP